MKTGFGTDVVERGIISLCAKVVHLRSFFKRLRSSDLQECQIQNLILSAKDLDFVAY